MDRRAVLLGGTSLFLAGCVGRWQTEYETGVDPHVSKNWRLSAVRVEVPDDLTVSNINSYAPDAEIVWHGEPFGNRKMQVGRIMQEGVKRGARRLPGRIPVRINVVLLYFHGVTPISVNRAPSAVHNISYAIRVFDARTGRPLTDTSVIQADLEANTGTTAVTAAIEGQTQRVRIVDHVAKVTAGWLGIGPDQRRTFTSVGR